jgi:hypothetical protein
MKFILSLYFLLSSSVCLALNVGFNQAWFHNDYGQQYLDHKFDPISQREFYELAAYFNNLNLPYEQANQLLIESCE